MFGLDNVMGGGGGLLGTLGGLVGTAFGGPIGGMIGSALGSALDGKLQDATGDAVKGAAKQLQQEHGMPKFLEELISQAVNDQIGSTDRNDASPEAQQQATDQFGPQIDDFRNDLQNNLVQNALDELKSSGSEGSNGKYSGGSWLVALSKAMGKALGQKTAQLVKLSNDINALPQGSKDPKVAQQMTAMTSEMQGVSQELKMFQETVSTVLKGIGEALSGMARKQ